MVVVLPVDRDWFCKPLAMAFVISPSPVIFNSNDAPGVLLPPAENPGLNGCPIGTPLALGRVPNALLIELIRLASASAAAAASLCSCRHRV